MNSGEVKKIIYLSVLFAVSVAMSISYLVKISLISVNYLRILSYCLSSIMLIWTAYFKWGWKLPVLRMVFNRPNLNGTWVGMAISNWKDADGRVSDPFRIALVIRQSFLSIHITAHTEKIISSSFAEVLTIDRERGQKMLVYLYREAETVRKKGVLLEGTCSLRLAEICSNPCKMCLKGDFWNSLGNVGSLSVNRINDEYIDTYEEIDEKTITRN